MDLLENVATFEEEDERAEVEFEDELEGEEEIQALESAYTPSESAEALDVEALDEDEGEALEEFEFESPWTGESEEEGEAGEWEAAAEVRDEDLFEARIEPEVATTTSEFEDESPRRNPTADLPGALERPDWPGRALRLVQPYMEGRDVRLWQERMIQRNWQTALGKPFNPDGVFGPLTAVVTTRFQQVQGLPIDGVVGPVTWGAAWNTGPKVTPAAPGGVFYDRAAAFDYAQRHWNVVCNDLFVAGTFGKSAFKKVPAGTKFVKESGRSEHALLPDGSKISWSELDDCTHFVSCCIGKPPNENAGGLPLKVEFPSGPYGIVGVKRMVDFLKAKKWVKVEGERSKDASLISKLGRGDLVAYFNESAGRYTHLTFYLGRDTIACHTYCRFDKKIEPACTWDDKWELGAHSKNYTWTFLRFIV
jgi:hypothetical protein